MLASDAQGEVTPSTAKRPSAGRITGSLVWFHRWLGIATCLVFALWFASGAVLLFQPFPSLSRDAQMELQRPVDLAAIRVAPSGAIHAAGTRASGLRLVQYGDQPAYLVEGDNKIVAVDARTGAALQLLNLAQAQALARIRRQFRHQVDDRRRSSIRSNERRGVAHRAWSVGAVGTAGSGAATRRRLGAFGRTNAATIRVQRHRRASGLRRVNCGGIYYGRVRLYDIH